METVEFLRKILPSSGLYIVARLSDKGLRHQVCDTVEEAAMYAQQFDAQGVTTYHACAAFRDRSVPGVKDGQPIKQVRTHRNVRALKSFWMDLDVKPGNPAAFESQGAAIEALVDFCNTTSLPIPMVVSSGGGIHVYWSMADDLLPETWKQTANGLKALAAAAKFNADPAVTSDPARILRPVGTHNRKLDGARPVELVADAAPLSFAEFSSAVIRALKTYGVAEPEGVRAVEAPVEETNQAFTVQHNFPPCSGVKVAERCKQLGKMRDTRGNITEPLWYAGIQLLCHSIEGDELIHRWSDGYEGYTREETERKITQVRSQSLGPTLCVTFEDRAPGGCDSCPFKGKISSPAQLGTHVASAPAPTVSMQVADVVTVVTLPMPPEPFTRGEKGGIFVESEGITHKIYDYDLFPTELAYDENLGFETMRIRHWLPKEGWKECVLQSSLLARPTDFEAKLRDNHIQPLIRNKMTMYTDAYLRKIRTDTKMRQLFKAQGWKNDDTEFVLGDRLYRKDEVLHAGISHGAEDFLKPFCAKGSLDAWRTLTWALGHPGFEPHAFMLLIGFAAPLLKLAGREGFTVNALGESGVGKSTMARFMSSIYGHPKAAWIGRKDTELARMQRLGAHFSLPVYMDEATTIKPEALRDLIYMIPTGKSRSSMTQDYRLRQGVEWATIFVTSTNDSLQAKLQIIKDNAEAESLRLFEFKFPRIADFGPIAKIIPAVIDDNYGVAGQAYIAGLVQNRDAIKLRLAEIVGETEAAFGMEDKERFWSQAVALTLYGGELARQWGIIDFDPEGLRTWLLSETVRMRAIVADSVVTPISMLGQYLNEFVGQRLVVTTLNAGMTAVEKRPMQSLTQRYEKDNGLLFIERQHLKHWMETHHFNYAEMRRWFLDRHILIGVDARKILGAGTDMTGLSVPCWKIKTTHPELAPVLEE